MGFGLALDSGSLEWAAAGAAALGYALLWPSLRRLPRPVAALRAAAAALLVLVLLKPVVHTLEQRSVKPRIAVLVDQGPGMQAVDDTGISRLSRAARWLVSHRAALESRAEVNLFAASGGARRLSWEDLAGLRPSPGVLEPAAVFSDVVNSGLPVSRVWLFSDGAFAPGAALSGGGSTHGAFKDGGPRAAAGGAALDSLSAPLDAFGVGPQRELPSVAVTEADSPDFVFLHSRFAVSAAVEVSGVAGRELRLRLLQDERTLSEKTFRVERPFEVFRATFPVSADGLGRQSFRFAASLADRKAEKSLKASRAFRIEVIRQKYRIMYLAGRPSMEYSHLRAQLKGDPNHELVSFVILRNPEDFSPVPDNELSLIPFPATEIFVDTLPQFDLFILENFAFHQFQLPAAYLENLKRFVSRGGALLVIGGSQAFTKGGYRGSPLEEVFPVALVPQSDDFIPGLFKPAVAAPKHPFLQMADTPEVSLGLWNSLPALDGYTRFSEVRPGATVLLAHPAEKTASGAPLPVVAVREFGRGKVMLVGTDSTWRWKLGGGLDWKLSSFYGKFWSRAVQYLTGSLELPKVKFSPLPDRMPAREPAVLALHVFDEHFRPVSGAELDLRVVWTVPGGAQRSPAVFESEPGVFQVELSRLAEGTHRVRAIARYRGQPWGEDSAEFRWEGGRGDLTLNRRGLKDLASRRGGKYSDLHQVDLNAALAALPPSRREQGVGSRRNLWSWPGWLWLIAGLLLGEWLLRRRRGWL